ncbi:MULTISPECIES: hypothetical protein [unclassified Microbacterium]|uniref:hypothetical protein n=1 Tax=unclassified Microbacterium TaxID=2609290 RepID=UPI00214C3C80|nr:MULTISPECIES: hypothetical protein [unclassified Microbacterium]MCR2811281.1 hypothetical protein [Microbacterium sp. zg.B185]WIM19439.1 hypothetical protein QNO12_01115 [Microbacterium sp. zg-B185]
MAHSSAWRVNDAVAFEALRDTSARVTALLLQVVRSDGPSAREAWEEVQAVRRESLLVNGYDRRAVDRLAARLTARALTLEGGS